MTSSEFYRFYPFVMSSTIHTPTRPAGARSALFSFSIVDNGYIYEELGIPHPDWRLQVRNRVKISMKL